jgi:hypothetical protein
MVKNSLPEKGYSTAQKNAMLSDVVEMVASKFCAQNRTKRDQKFNQRLREWGVPDAFKAFFKQESKRKFSFTIIMYIQ